MIERADHIIAVSENTKKDLMDICGVKESKISVIYHGYSTIEDFDKTSLKLPSRYILFIGNRKRYKNFYFFISSLKIVFKKDQFLKLIVAGSPFSSEELTFIKEQGLEDYIIFRKANDIDLACLYSNAQAFIYPSIYEGFGMPILEAFSYNCPVLLSNTSCFPEIAGDAVIYFDPKNIVDISDKIISVINNTSLREDLILKGRKRLSEFGWNKATQRTFEVYKKVITT
jgi:glycosyltransferase involved in cell wall biosynthesis